MEGQPRSLYEFMCEAPILTIILALIIGSCIVSGMHSCSNNDSLSLMNCRGACWSFNDAEQLECTKECFKSNEEITKVWRQEQTNDLRNR